MIERFRVHEPLPHSEELFRRPRVGDVGTDVVWTDEIALAADTLRRLAEERSGAALSTEAFRRWRERKAHTLDAAAKALGVSRRIFAYYEKGQRPIFRVVAPATRTLELV